MDLADLTNLPRSTLSGLNLVNLETLKAFSFAVEIDGHLPIGRFVAGFSRVEGLEDRVKVKTIDEGGFPGTHRFPGRRQNSPVRLIRGMSLDQFFWEWWQQVVNWVPGQPSYCRTLSVYITDRFFAAGRVVTYEAWRWDIFDAWISNWKGPGLDANRSAFALEEIEIQHSGILKQKGLIGAGVGTALGALT